MIALLALAAVFVGMICVGLKMKRGETTAGNCVDLQPAVSHEEVSREQVTLEPAVLNSVPSQALEDIQELSAILQLKEQLSQAFKEETSRGHTLGLHQDGTSADRLQGVVQKHIQQYFAEGHQDWKDYVQFNEHHYVRNLVFADENFELMVLCWKYGQGSRVHNHGQSHCWLSVLQGCIQEHQYQMPEASDVSATPAAPPSIPGVLSAVSPCPKLRHVQTNELQAGQTGYINDGMALHAVRVPEHCEGQGAVTLHLYAPPIRKVKLYEPDNNRIVQRQPGFFTVGLGRSRLKQAKRELQPTLQGSCPHNWDI